MLEIIIAIIVGILYYKMMDASVPTESNCSFLANPLTDFLAFLWGAIVIYYGKLYKNKVLIFHKFHVIHPIVFLFPVDKYIPNSIYFGNI